MLCLAFPTVVSAENSKASKDTSVVKADFADKSVRFQPARGLGRTEGITRRDPSDVIKVGDTFFAWS